ncbi:TIR domain-containing protein [Ramlibacter sp. XY19]|uniref:TIR domain-containing protein n=1 Tax=Ramlibacter paludis TaxID=2908000 RepID=UPI0023DC063D|nr:TIR domain-containing protein [Ramlibacter paludis]MCG2593102.1 TIR domain-containing protein [Ramlibacter paludis]
MQEAPVLDLEAVFNEAAFPEHTYVDPKEYPFIKSALRAKGKHVTISGASGSGKTTVVNKILRDLGIKPTEILLINGREYKHHTNYLEMLGAIVGVDPTYDEIAPYLASQRLVIIDDFHHLSESVKDGLSEDLKLWHEKAVRFVLIGIASSARDLAGNDKELGIRNDVFDLRTQDEKFVRQLMVQGAGHLRLRFSERFIQETAAGSKGIPSVVQAICRTACIKNGIERTQAAEVEIDESLANIRQEVLRIFEHKYFDKIVALSKGKLQAKSVHNTYFDIVAAIAKDERSDIPTEYLYRTIVAPITDPKKKNQKSTSYYNCLNYLGDVIKDSKLDDVIMYRKGKSISIEDPTFRFYLNLLDLDDVRRRIHIRNDEYPWDVAVSFAGEDRPTVLNFVKGLEEKGIFPFYDFNYQAQLWGVDLQKRLADIYANDALYMVIFISSKYPEKDWTRFEFEIGKSAGSKRPEAYILPIIIEDVPMVGLANTLGKVFLKDHDIAYCVDLLTAKLTAEQ